MIPGDAARDLKEDKKTKVADLEPDGAVGSYEAHVYSNNIPEQGRKFGSATALPDPNPADGYQYQLNADNPATTAADPNTVLTIDNTNAGTGWAACVASSSFDQKAGKKFFKTADNQTVVQIASSYHGVSGTYYCAPTNNATGCSSEVAASGFNLADGVWTFKASNNEIRVTSKEPDNYLSFGWWLHKSEDDKTYTASAFYIEKGTVTDASIGNEGAYLPKCQTLNQASTKVLWVSSGTVNEI